MITVYTKPECPYSRALLRKLKHDKKDFHVINVLANQAAYEEMLKLNGGISATPTWIESGNVFVGFHGACPIEDEDLPWLAHG